MALVIGFNGVSRSGKDTAVDFAIQKFGGARMAFADPLKAFVKEIFDFTDEQVYGNADTKNSPDFRYRMPNGEFLTPRWAMQSLGAEWGRALHPDVWVNYLFRKARHRAGIVYVSDVRYPNEVAAIRASGGKVIRLLRGEVAFAHSSETSFTEMSENLFNAVIDNREMSLEDFRLAVESTVEKIVGE